MEFITVLKGWLYDLAKLYRKPSIKDDTWKKKKPVVRTVYPKGMSEEKRISYNELWKHLHDQMML